MSLRTLLTPPSALLLCSLLVVPAHAASHPGRLPSAGRLLIKMVAAQARANSFHQETTLILVSGRGSVTATTAEHLHVDATLKPRRFHGVANMTQRGTGSLRPQFSHAEEYIVKHQVAMTQNGQNWQCSTTEATRASLHANALAPTTLAGPLSSALGSAQTVHVVSVKGVPAWDVHVILSTTLAGSPIVSSVDYFIRRSDDLLLRDTVIERLVGADQPLTETGTDVYSHYGKKIPIALPSACK